MGVTDLYSSWGQNIEHAGTFFLWNEELIIISQLSPQKTYHKWNIEQARSTNVWCSTQLAKFSLNYSIGRTHSLRFSTFHDPIPTILGETRNKYDTGNYYYCTKNTTDVWHLTPPTNINTNTATACDTSRIKVDITDTMVLRKMIRSSYVYNSNPPINHIM